ncbi:DUF1893 domain-containing protein [Caloranaerobacter sp. DY30410]|uniref:DUF1893 domain-containing protein n=1 Tax=Caloranaerobacter sp. DY30410 TaxID=3238305 RepID=UPI003D073159
MRDIELAKNYLHEQNLSLVIVKDNKVILKEREKGIKPLLKAVLEKKELIKGGALADKVIGKAAAMLSVSANINSVYTKLISYDAIDILKKWNVELEYEKKVPYILNRDKTGLCPIERLSMEQDNVNILIEDIKGFLKL